MSKKITKADDTQEFLNEIEREIPVIQEEDDDSIDYNSIMQGPLAFDRRNIKDGFKTKFVGDTPGSIEIHKKLGYEVVTDQFNVGDDHASKISRFGSAVTVQSPCGMLLVLMQISEDKYTRFEKWKAAQSAKQVKGIGYSQQIPQSAQEFNGLSLSQLKMLDN